MAILRFGTKRILYLIALCALITVLFGPYIFVHFPRTCIPFVDPVYQTGRPVSAAENGGKQIKHHDPRIIILSGELCTNPDPDSKCRRLGEYSHYNRREYVAHHRGRYDLRDSNVTHYFEEVKAVGAVPAWAKIKMIKDELAKDDHDWIFWMDTDALFANMDIQLDRFIDNRYSFIAAKDWFCLNAGVFFIKNNDWSRKFIDIVWSRLEAFNHEQDWMINVLANTKELDEHKNTKYLPQCSFNSYWHMKKLYEMYRPGDFIIHWGAFNWDVQSFKDWQELRYFKLPSSK